MKRLFLLGCFCGAGFLSAQNFEFSEVDWERVEREARGFIEGLGLELDLPAPEQVVTLLRAAETVIRQGSWEEFARFAPQARALRDSLAADERLRPYLDWFEPRMDYFVFSEVMLRPPPPPPTPAPGRVVPTPTPRPPLERRVDDPSAWERRARTRPQPRGAAEWVPRLKPVFAEEGVPPEWVWLAEVESSFNPNARSPVGALGLFQFMPRTAESLGLRLEPRDERTDPDKSARAAARYLRELHRRFNDWPLVLAAYNAGQGRVAGLTRRHGNSFEDISAHLPAETRVYVPKVLATVAEREGVNPRTLPAPSAR